jgi:hypothetical protein
MAKSAITYLRGQSMVDIQLEDGWVIHCHFNHVKDHTSSSGPSNLLDSNSDYEMLDLRLTMDTTLEAPDTALVEPVTDTNCRRSTRIRRAPDHLEY